MDPAGRSQQLLKGKGRSGNSLETGGPGVTLVASQSPTQVRSPRKPVQPAAQDGPGGSPTHIRKLAKTATRRLGTCLSSSAVGRVRGFSVGPQTTVLLPAWPRDTAGLDAAGLPARTMA